MVVMVQNVNLNVSEQQKTNCNFIRRVVELISIEVAHLDHHIHTDQVGMLG